MGARQEPPSSKTPCRLSISTLSLGQSYAGHSLEQRLDQASQHGYQGIELFYDDLEYIAQTLPLVPPSSFTTTDSTVIPTTILMAAPTTAPTDSQLVRAAALVRAMCATRRLAVICLQPFRHFEGLVSRDARAHRLAELHLWCRLAGILRTDLILIPSNFLPAGQVTGEFKFIVQDLREAAEIAAAATPPLGVAQQVDRPNFGLCLDTFNIAARVYADPAVSGGVQPEGPQRLTESVKELAAAVSVDRVFLVQIADGARLAAPLVPGHPLYDADSPARMTWSRQHRLFYGEDDRSGYLPVDQVLAAILGDLGYRGWLSFELFNRRTSGTDASVPAEMARRGAASWAKLVEDFGLETGGGGKTGPQTLKGAKVAEESCATKSKEGGAGESLSSRSGSQRKSVVRLLTLCGLCQPGSEE
ncbi:4-hydroxyphenylpyruvate dioxygenase [Sporothrix schenckii 1099-18]|uniref:4-hydroxyphenylpyruvate dioxygenase n=1 Tax=Sporothrix schenckii 1099-18 TaxID=1397361 RepID=A0A0F2LZY2_SPOSC|nr:4-hydroxyphenylpyruvate dioxygenase [Sporothrix schenckii 1099-18]KJR82409.1 4-hydroxyphenylpyruvate dioxygenase [Sporothrix schenckii 1099-18]